jgi:hypothetical protein
MNPSLPLSLAYFFSFFFFFFKLHFVSPNLSKLIELEKNPSTPSVQTLQGDLP